MKSFSKDDKYRIMAIILAVKQLEEHGIDDYYEIIRYVNKHINDLLDYVDENYFLATKDE